MTGSNLLAYLGLRLINQLENLATESLWYLLTTYKSANHAFSNSLKKVGVEYSGQLTFDCQVSFPGRAIPDLVGTDSQGNHVVLVESKFGAPLTPNQPDGYLEKLPSHTPGIVLFLLPESMCADYWRIILERVKNSGNPISTPAGKENEVFSVRVGSVRRLAHMTWEHLLETVKSEMRANSDEVGLGELRQLVGLVHSLTREKHLQVDLPVSGIQNRAKELQGFIDMVVSELVAQGEFETQGYRATPGPGYYRRYGTV